MSVVFPPPEGEETMKRDPRGALVIASFDVLHLLADLLGFGLHLEDLPRGGEVPALGADGVELPEDLLRQEVEAFADAVRRPRQKTPELIEMSAQALQLLRDVGPVRGQRRFLLEPAGIERDIGEERAHPLLDRGGELAGDVGAAALQDVRLAPQELDPWR